MLTSNIYELKCKKNQLIYDEFELKSRLKVGQSIYCSVCGDQNIGRTKICFKCLMPVHFKCLFSDGKHCLNCAR
ncbi:hypothetical protein SteCoe_38050 [Stentor coeruleus]|uniref:Phorbol-ester/DAG-type domain-containing protein n=1 Tax=Stentor coeruleus TaxID=5963 RepID=A0A1R2ALX3_9CILI|nr:hypothetical protein SteCoe_38050 [Stentor coeruleus]